jgi:ubiquinone biosynthesis protein
MPANRWNKFNIYGILIFPYNLSVTYLDEERVKLMPMILTPGWAFKHLQRYRQVVGILSHYGYGEFFGQIRIWRYVNIDKKLLHRKGELAQLSSPERLRLALEALGPTFVKLGQMLSTRPDILPQSYIRELEKLQNRVAPITTEAAKQIIESELKQPISKIFSTFNDQPLAAASLAQVHRATINGEEVVVKVQRPNITRTIEVDLDIMHSMASLMERYLPNVYIINPVGIVREFSENIKRELDFRQEAANMRRFALNFADNPWVHVPRVYPENYCSQRVITMEYIDGIFISDIERLKKENYDLKLIAKRGAEVGFRSTLDYGFFHADPHPGNLVILPGNVICLLDYGMMGTLSTRLRERLGKLIYGIVSGDEKRTARALLGLMESSEVIDAETLEAEVSDVIQYVTHLTLADIQLGGMLFKLLRLLRSHRVRFPIHLIWLSKALTSIEETAHKLDPDLEILKSAKPFARRYFIGNFSPSKRSRESLFAAVDSFELLKDLPYDVGVIIDQLKKGRVKIEFEHIGLEPIRRTLSVVASRLAMTLIIAALLIASALIVSAGIGPKFGEVSIIGIAGFFIAGVLAIGLVISILFRK